MRLALTLSLLLEIPLTYPTLALTAPPSFSSTGVRNRVFTPHSTPLLAQQQVCSPPALSRITRHRVASGETLDTIARRYNLLPTTLMGFNPALQSGKAAVGTEILIPPFNGIRVDVKPGQTLRDVAKAYGVRPDVLFEVNGCQPAPKAVFIPGVNWSPVGTSNSSSGPSTGQILSGSPFPTPLSESSILQRYGYGVQGNTSQVAFHSGIDLAAPSGTPVLAVGDGTIAFAGQQGVYGNLVVINHLEGLQTRYAQLGSIRVKAGQTVKRGQTIGTVGTSGRPSSKNPHLHFEVRSRSNLGWVAEDPTPVLKLQVQRQGARN
ncbi:M23 family metallopeptidase [Leptodesmis sichuanensis]|uniref:M23 family metallopeptidase n=2 Tax=Leptodesmis TaxID=2664261 RepID=UPI001F185B45|nr:M23 family metallopeptidase [Leptodesmis sichuanensis]UIE39279.1 M23 family metallopeptidase [Leptodesmis sichuanensis A121]